MTTTISDRETAALIAALNDQRDHVLGILEGLSEEDLRRPVLPSGWSCLGLLAHLTWDVERFWFSATVAADPDAIAASLSDNNSWQVPDDLSQLHAFAAYRRQIDIADAIIATRSLEAEPDWWGPFFGDWRLHTLREIILHVLVETACHAGHLDAARELIDGRQWMPFE